MKQIILILLIGIFLVSFISAQCKSNNDFEIGDNFDICSGRCKYEITAGNYFDCNSSVQCYLTIGYPNGSILGFFKEMEFNNSGSEIYNYSFGKLTDTAFCPEGIYNGQINCYWSNGWSDPINFEASVSSEEISYVSYTGNPTGYNIKLPSKEEIIDGTLNKVREKIWLFVIILGGFVLMIVLIYDYKKHKFKKLITKVKKELGMKR